MGQGGILWVTMFRGVNQLSIDAKGRLNIPSRYRQILEQQDEAQLVITIDTEENSLLLYPLSTWEQIEKKIESLPTFNKAVRRIQRLLIGHATEANIDGNGRLLLPSSLRDYAKITKQVVLVGQGKKLELWDLSLWEKSRQVWLAENSKLQDEIPEDLQALSL